MTRTHLKHSRLYIGGYDLSGYTFAVSNCGEEYDAQPEACLNDAVMSVVIGQPTVTFGPVNGVFDNTATSGLHVLHSGAGDKAIVTYALGMSAAPAAGDPVFCGEWQHRVYLADSSRSGAVGATLEFGGWAADAETLVYGQGWGRLLHASAAATGANGGTADHDNGAATSAGGYGVLQVLAGNGTATFTIEAAATNTDAAFDSAGALLTFDTTDASSPFAEIKTLSKTASVARYLRWQVTLGTASSVTFVMSFVRGK